MPLSDREQMLSAFVSHQGVVKPLVGNTADIFPFSSGQTHFVNGQYRHIQTNALDELMSRRKTGLFNVVAQVAPTGGANFEDISLLDPSDKEQWALVVVIQTDTEIRMFRRYYSGMPDKPVARDPDQN